MSAAWMNVASPTMMTRNVKMMAATAISALTAVSAKAALAVNTKTTGLDDTAMKVYGKVGANTDLAIVIGRILNGFLSLLGIVFVVLVIYGGILWMTSRGNQETVKKAQATITGAAVGFMLVMGAYAISDFVINAVVSAALGGTQSGP